MTRSVSITEQTVATVTAELARRTAARQAGPSSPRKERDIQRAILDLLHARGVLAWKAGSGAFRVQAPGQRERYVRMGHAGVSDIIGALPGGRFLAIEIKRPGAEPTQGQAAFLARVQMAGGVAFVASSCDDVARALGWTG